MCSQPIVHDAQFSRATWRAAASSSAARLGAAAKLAAWKLRVGSVAMALNARRFASVPTSRYLAVAGPNERSRNARAAATTPGGSAGATFVTARTATAFRRFAPMIAPPPPPPPPPRPGCPPGGRVRRGARRAPPARPARGGGGGGREPLAQPML